MQTHRRRGYATVVVALAASALLLSGCTAPGEPPGSTQGASPTGDASEPGDSTDASVQRLLDEAAARAVETHSLGSLIAEIRIDGEVVAQTAIGEAMGGVPVTLDGRFRNGAVAITYLSTLLMRLVDDGVVDLDEPIATWLPDFPEADRVTPRMLANMTAGYPDHVANPEFIDAVVDDPFHAWTDDTLLAFSLGAPRSFEPGENWDYSHSDYIVLGLVLEAATGERLADLLAEHVLEPLGLDATVAEQGTAIPDPVVHAFTAERGVWEDSTWWNPSWTLPEGAVQTSSIGDIASSFDAIVGRGDLLEPDSWQQLIAPDLIGFGHPVEGCRACGTLTENWSYGLGTILVGDWVKQTPLFGGYASAVLTLPASRADDGRSVTVAVAITYTRDTFPDWGGNLANHADALALELGGELVPDDPPPTVGPQG
ncbi:serine hydrolase domain-containing protein [Agromyces larvae]|uniref:Beta-lactamase family protein n=1 Tax=Agromyces larvae TaxID=2929802 RepID=A0ABY4C276_9MICO|nr:serine hydrolase domain-containing protein [Agromyces larvae]UOE42880.1 beta-lactamase family protein [Agromyces larvae]